MNGESILTKGNIDPVSLLHYTIYVLHEGMVAKQYEDLIIHKKKHTIFCIQHNYAYKRACSFIIGIRFMIYHLIFMSFIYYRIFYG